MQSFSTSPFHEGEAQVQARAGMREKAERLGQMAIRDFLPDQHRAFFEMLPFIIIASVDEEGRPWASLVAGQPGFIGSPDEKTLIINARLLPGDPLYETLHEGSDIGVLGIEPETRRRNRMNGVVADVTDRSFTIKAVQSYGNCPKFIQTRSLDFTPTDLEKPKEVLRSDKMSDDVQALIAKSDTFFIATAYTKSDNNVANGADASHRGGKPGFVRVESNKSLLFPDFAGNNAFNTLGNIHLNPKAGLLFIDFENGDMVYTSGTAEIIWEGPVVEQFAGALRAVRLHLDDVIISREAFPFTVKFGDYSPFLSKTGTWA